MKDNNYCTIYLARHGETEHNINEVIQGHIDSPLTQLGQQQAKELAEHFKGMHFDAMFSSDIMRAHNTAKAVALDKALVVNTTKLLRERFFGVYEGRTIEDYKKENREMLEKRQSLAEAEKRVFRPYPDFENDEEVVSRMLTFLREVAVSYTGKTVLAVSHGSIISSLLIHLGVAKRGQIWIENTGYVRLSSDGVDFIVEEMNNVKITDEKVEV